MNRFPRTLEEVQTELESDPEFQRQQAEREERRRLRAAALQEEEQPILENLSKAGIQVSSIWDLVNTKEPYPNAIETLSHHLGKNYSKRTREGIIRALTVKEARGSVGQQLIRMFEKEDDDDLRWVIGNTLSVVATEEQVEELRRLLSDSAFGQSRSMLIHALARLCGRNAAPEIIGKLDDSDCSNEAIIALGELRVPEAIRAIEPFLDHSDSYVRDISKRALKKISNAKKK